jgi:hypothetical protein
METINSSKYEIISLYKYKINLLSLYLEETFKTIKSSLTHCEEQLKDFIKNQQSKSNLNTKDSSNANSQNSEYEEIEDLIEIFGEIYGKKKKVGKYHWKIRTLKIIKYKMKLINRKVKIPIITKYYGRAKVAQQKPRMNGRFIKKSHFMIYN